MSSSVKQPFLQSIEGFTFIACILIFLQGMYSAGLVPATLSAWEGAFKLTTSEVGPAVTCYVISKLIVGIPLTYVTSAGHVPKHLAWMFALIGVTAIITAIPWVLTTAAITSKTPNVCYKQGHPEAALCNVDKESNGYQYFVFIAQTVNGFAAACLYALAPSYIESNSSKKSGPKNLAYFLASAPLGVAFGFILQGIAVDAGVWGLPYLFCGVLLIIFSVFMWRMPASMTIAVNMASSADVEEEEISTTSRRRSSFVLPKKTLQQGLQDFGADAKIIMTNGTWWLFALAASVEAFFVTGINNYGPKIFSSYFSVSSGQASMIAGALLVPAAVFGQICGGFCDSKRSKSLNDTAGLTKWVALVALGAVLSIYVVQCPTLEFETREEKTCGTSCHCLDRFDPVCFDEKIIHFNGCYAGCSEYTTNSSYNNCTACGGNSSSSSVTHGVCDSVKCNQMGLMIVVFFGAVFFTFMNNPPSQIVMMRIVPPKLSANALALNDLVYRLLGSLPSVPVWAAAIDSTCLHRNKDVCGVEGECGYYDNSKLSGLFLALGGIPKFFSFVFFMAGALYLKTKMSDLAEKKYNDDDDEDNKSGDAKQLQEEL